MFIISHLPFVGRNENLLYFLTGIQTVACSVKLKGRAFKELHQVTGMGVASGYREDKGGCSLLLQVVAVLVTAIKMMMRVCW